MSQRPPCPPGASWVSPYLVVRNPEEAIAFYQRAFGFTLGLVVPGPDGKPAHVEMKWQDILIMFGPEVHPQCQSKSPATSGLTSPIGLLVYCADVDAFYKHATANGATGVQPPQNMFWGDRMCRLKDPNGYDWSFATNVADFDPSQMPK